MMAASVPVDFNGTWKLETTSPNLEDLLKAMEFGFVLRKALVNLTPEIIIKQDGDDFQMMTKTIIKSQEIKFKMGEEFKEKHPFKDVVSHVLITWEGSAMVQKVTNSDKDPVVTRTIEDGKLVVKQKLGDIEVIRTFTKVVAS